VEHRVPEAPNADHMRTLDRAMFIGEEWSSMRVLVGNLTAVHNRVHWTGRNDLGLATSAHPGSISLSVASDETSAVRELTVVIIRTPLNGGE